MVAELSCGLLCGCGWLRSWLWVVEAVIKDRGVRGQDVAVGQSENGLAQGVLSRGVCAGSRPRRRAVMSLDVGDGWGFLRPWPSRWLVGSGGWRET